MKLHWERLTPIRYALVAAGIYFALAVGWIFFSTEAVSLLAESADDLARIEAAKGYGFVAVTSILFFIFSRAVFVRISENSEQLLRSQQRLVQAERDAISGLISASIAHDFGNILTVMRVNVSRLESLPEIPADALDYARRVDSGLTKLAELAERLRSAGRNVVRGEPTRYTLSQAVGETLGLLRGHKTVQGCAIETSFEPDVTLIGYPILVHQLLMNLVLNAAEATEGRGRIRILVTRDGEAARIEVHDNGPGVAPPLRENVFDAFFTTKRFGSGLGLLSVKSCAEIHGGTVEVADSSLGGALFRVTLPNLNDPGKSSHKFSESLNKGTLGGLPEPSR